MIDEGTGRNVAVTYDKVDAPIVAAAPDLLAACEELVELAAGFDDADHDPDDTPIVAPALARARAAIAKAKRH